MQTVDIKKSDRVSLSEKSKDELIDEILRLREENEKLRKNQPPFKILFPKRKLKKRWKKLGRPEGHPGTTRKKPDKIDHIEHQRLEVCPDCGCKHLSELSTEKIEHVQEDIVPAVVEATKFMRHGYWCPECKSKKIAPYAPFEVPYGYLGPNILIQAVLMKYHYGVSYGKMKSLFKSFCNLKVTTSALAQALQRISQWLDMEEKVIIEAVRLSPYLHIDETGWKIAGTNHWLWNFVNERLALCRIRRSRGRSVPEEILTKDYGGIIISDFLSAYDKSGKKRQRCLVHLERDMNKYREQDKTEESQRTYKKLKRILTERMIRPNVLWRKISFQNMSIKGADTHEILMSLLQTLRLRKQDPIDFFKKAYLKHRQGDPIPILSL